MKTTTLRLVAAILLAAWLPPLAAQDSRDAQCAAALGPYPIPPSPDNTQQFTTVIPVQARSTDVLTVCTQGLIYADHLGFARSGNRITFTIYDNGFSWGPNPIIPVNGNFGPLPPGHYLLDTVIDSGWDTDPGTSIYVGAHDVPFDVLAETTAVPAADIGTGAMLAAMLGTLGAMAALRRR